MYTPWPLPPTVGSLLACGDNSAVYLWRLATGDEIPVIAGHAGRISRMAFSPDGRFLISASSDTTVRVWDGQGAREVVRFTEHRTMVSGLAVSPDGRIVASCCRKFAYLWERDTGRVLRRLSGDDGFKGIGNTLAFAPNGQTLAVGTLVGPIYIWQLDPGKILQEFHYPKKTTVHSLAYSPDSKFLASRDLFGVIYLWDLATQKPRWVQEAPSPLRDMAFSSDGATLAAGGGRFVRT